MKFAKKLSEIGEKLIKNLKKLYLSLLKIYSEFVKSLSKINEKFTQKLQIFLILLQNLSTTYPKFGNNLSNICQ